MQFPLCWSIYFLQKSTFVLLCTNVSIKPAFLHSTRRSVFVPPSVILTPIRHELCITFYYLHYIPLNPCYNHQKYFDLTAACDSTRNDIGWFCC